MLEKSGIRFSYVFHEALFDTDSLVLSDRFWLDLASLGLDSLFRFSLGSPFRLSFRVNSVYGLENLFRL